MNPSAAAPPSTAIRSLPPLGGGLLAAYRAVWTLLLVTAIAVLGRMVLGETMQLPILGLRLIKAGVLLTVSTILFRRRQSDGVAAMLSLAFLLWAVTSSFDLASGAWWPTVLDRVRFLLFALALLLFPQGQWSPGWTRQVGMASILVCLIGIAEAVGMLATSLFLPLAILCVLAAIGALLTRYRRLGETAEKRQLKWVALGLTAGIALILAARAGAALMTPLPPALLESLFQLGIVTIALGFLVSLLRYRLYDAETVISRSAAYALLTLSLVATFAASEALIQNLGQQYFGSGIGNVSGAVAAAIAAALLTPLNSRISAWAERHFQRDLLILKQQLPDLLAELSAMSSTARVGEAALPRIGQAVHASHSALLVDGRIVATSGIARRPAAQWARDRLPIDSLRPLERGSASTFVLHMPLHCPFGSLRGWLLLGPRPDGSAFARDDVDALMAISGPLRTALFAAREREKERARDQAARRSIRTDLAVVLARVAALEVPAGAGVSSADGATGRNR